MKAPYRPYRGSRLEPTGKRVVIGNEEEGYEVRNEMQEILPASFPYQRIATWLLGGAMVVLILLGLVTLWTILTGGVIQLVVTYPAHAHGGALLPTPGPIRSTTP